MDLLEHLKQFKNIEPDRSRAAISRARILAHSQKERRAFAGIFGRLFAHPALAAAAVVLVVFGGGFYSLHYFKNKIALNPQSLQAEAQAIDIQIDLANLQYKNVASGKTTIHFRAVPKTSTSTSTSAGTGTATSTPPDMTIDQALNALSSM